MAGVGQPAVERLRGFLRELPEGARALLIAELERGMLHGEGHAGAELILNELRRNIRDSQSTAERMGEDARLFFLPLQPFLVDDAPDHRHWGRLARSALRPIWMWLTTSVMPDEAKIYSEQIEAALTAGHSNKVQQLARLFQDEALRRIQAVLSGGHDSGPRRTGALPGTPRALEDLQTMAGVLKARDGLAMLGGQLPGHIKSLHGSSLDRIKAQLDAKLNANPEMFNYALLLVMDRLAAAWQLIRLATKAADSDVAARIEETPYTAAIDIVLAEIARMVGELSNDLKSGRGIAVGALLKDVHDAVRGLRSELDLSKNSNWSRQLAAIRADISKLLSAEINLMPGRVRRLMRPRAARDIANGSVVDPADVAEAESLIGFVMACRNYAGELAINEVTQRTFTDLQQCLDTGTKALLDALRMSGEVERPYRQSQVDAAVRFCAKVFGQDYASLLTKAADVASHGERKIAARA